jgi:hypothetical protein
MTFAKRDILRYYFPVWNFSVEALKDGIFPLWNPYNSYGTPFFADIQTCVVYPLSLLLFLPDYLWAFNFYILVHLALAGFFTVLWMRDCGASREAALCSGVAFSLSGYVMSAINLTISLSSLVWFPLVLLSFRRSLASRGMRWKALGGAALTAQYLAGDPSIVFCTLVVCCLYTLFAWGRACAEKKTLTLKVPLRSAAMVLFFAGFSAFHWLLFAEFLRNSSRANPTFDVMTMWSMQINDILSFVIPNFSDASLFFMNYWERQSWLETGYMGITVLVFAAAALLADKRDLVRYHFLLFLLGIGLALGRFCLVYGFFFEFFPFFKYIRYPVRFLFISHFAAACLAGFGLDALLKWTAEHRPLASSAARRTGLLLVAGTAGVLATMWWSEAISAEFLPRMDGFMRAWTKMDWTMEQTEDLVIPVLVNLKRTAVLVLFLASGALCVRQFKVRRVLAASFFFLLVAGDLVEANNIEMRVDGRFLGAVGEHMKVILKDKSVFRAHAAPSASKLQTEPALAPSLENMLEKLLEILTPNLLLPHRVAYTSGYDSLFLQDSVRMNAQGQSIQHPAEHRFLDMMNIKYVVSRRGKLDASYVKLGEAEAANLFRNDNAMPRAFLVPEAVHMSDREEILKTMVEATFDPAARLYLDGPVPGFSGMKRPLQEASDGVEILDYGPNRIVMKAVSSTPQWLFLSDAFYPGWKATLNGDPVPIHRANFMFRAIQVPPGEWTVRWNYDPLLFRIGCTVSLLTLAAAAALWRERGRS